MIRKTLSVLLAFAVSVSVSAACRRGIEAAQARRPQRRLRAQQPTSIRSRARMNEVRPGDWISSWGCVTDDGYGRIGSCDRRKGSK